MLSTVHLHTEPDGKPAEDVGNVDIVIDSY
jgi:hypothetical protein